MKKTVLTLLALVACIHVFAQPAAIEWQRSLGGTALDAASDALQMPDGGYVFAGRANSNDVDVSGNHGFADMWVVKLSPAGVIEWQRALGGSNNDEATSIARTIDGGFIVAGFTASNDGQVSGNHGGNDYWVVKLDDTGALQWKKCLGGSAHDFARNVIQTSDGGYVVTGESFSNNGNVTGHHGLASFYDCWVVKLNDTGGLVWQRSLGGTNQDMGGPIVQTSDGKFLLAASTSSSDGDVSGLHGVSDYWLVRLDDTGAIEWQKCLGGTQGDNTAALIKVSSGGYMVSGTSASADGDITGHHASSDMWVVRLDDAGTILWQKSYGGAAAENNFSVIEVPGNGFFVSGSTQSVEGDIYYNHGLYDYWVIKIDDTGGKQWQKCYGGTGLDEASAAVYTTDGGYLLAGYSASNDSDVTDHRGTTTLNDCWIVKLNCNVVAGVITGPDEVCIGSGILLADTATGGTWSTPSTNITLASGAVTATAMGTATVSYTKGSTCGGALASAIKTITVNPLPTPVITDVTGPLSTTLPYVTYQWLDGTTIIPGETNSTFSEPGMGVWAVIVTDTNGCSDTSAMFVILESVTDPSGSGLVLSPNPTSGYIYLPTGKRADMIAYDATGRTIRRTVNTNELYLGDMPPGLYMVRAVNKDGLVVAAGQIQKE